MPYIVTRQMDWKNEITGEVTRRPCWLNTTRYAMPVTEMKRVDATVYATKVEATKAARKTGRRWQIVPA